MIEKPWNRNATYCQEWEEAQIGREIVKNERLASAKAAVKCLGDDLQIADLLRCSKRQVCIRAVYEDPETELRVPVQCLIDLEPAHEDKRFGMTLADFKTCENASVRSWENAVFNNGYDAQGAMYLDLHNAATGQGRTDFLHVVQESYAPWESARRILSSEFIEIGRMKYQEALRRYCQCLKTGNWPGYDEGGRAWNGWRFIEPLPWMLNAA